MDFCIALTNNIVPVFGLAIYTLYRFGSRELSAAQSTLHVQELRVKQAELTANYFLENAYPNNVNQGTALRCIIKKTPGKYELCRVAGSRDNRWKLTVLKSDSKYRYTSRPADRQRFLSLLEK